MVIPGALQEAEIIIMMHLVALAAACLLAAFTSADDSGLPSDWRTGIATNYGGAQDGKVNNMSNDTVPWVCTRASLLVAHSCACYVLACCARSLFVHKRSLLCVLGSWATDQRCSAMGVLSINKQDSLL